MVYTDYKFYTEEFFGTMPEDSFNRFNMKASAILKQNTYNRITEPFSIEVKQCACALIELLEEENRIGSKSSESNDGYSVTYKEMPFHIKAGEIIRIYLLHTGLLHVGCYE